MMKQSRLIRALAALAVCAFALAGQSAGAQTWINWTQVLYSGTNPIGAIGVINLASGPVTVTYSGDMFGAQLDNTGDNHWLPASSFSGPGFVGPTNSGIIELKNASSNNVLTFSQAVNDLYFSFWSVGDPTTAVSYTFNHPFTVVASGPNSQYGCGSPCVVQSGNTLTGREGNGTLLFNGPITSVGFDVNPAENWHGFTVGSTSVVTPEPATMTLLATGLVGVFGAAVRRRKSRGV
jgi:hypothetical protein